MYAKIINEQTKQVATGNGNNKEMYDRLGFSEMEVEQAWDGAWYLAGYAPDKPQEEKEKEVRAVRNQYLEATDIYMLADFPLSDEEREDYKAYRQYLRDYTDIQDWYEKNPLTFEEWKQIIIDSSDEE